MDTGKTRDAYTPKTTTYQSWTQTYEVEDKTPKVKDKIPGHDPEVEDEAPKYNQHTLPINLDHACKGRTRSRNLCCIAIDILKAATGTK